MTNELQTLNHQLSEAQSRLKTLESEVLIFREELKNAENAEAKAREDKPDIRTLSRLKTETIAAKQLVLEGEAAVKAVKEKISGIEKLKKPEELKNKAIELARQSNEVAEGVEARLAKVATAVMENIEDFKAIRAEMKKLPVLRDDFINTLHQLERLNGQRIVHEPYPNHFVESLEKYVNLDMVLSPWKGSTVQASKISRIIGIRHTTVLSHHIEMIAMHLENEGFLVTHESLGTNEGGRK